jgi:plastocyanin
MDGGESFSFRFDKPGTYKYLCSIHPRMTGAIVVK